MGELQEQVDDLVSETRAAVAAAAIVQTAEQITAEANQRAENAETVAAAVIEAGEEDRRNMRVTELEGRFNSWQGQYETTQAELSSLRLEMQETRTEIARVTGLLEGLTVALQPEPEPLSTPPASPSPEVTDPAAVQMPSPSGESPDASPVKNTTRPRRRFI